jgi:hypothetical protein
MCSGRIREWTDLIRFSFLATTLRRNGDGMSDEPKKRSRKWLWIAVALLAALVLYPLSMGPASRYTPFSEMDKFNAIYAPVAWTVRHSEWAMNAFRWYMRFWEPDDPFSP